MAWINARLANGGSAIEPSKEYEHVKSTIAIIKPYLENQGCVVTKSTLGNCWIIKKVENQKGAFIDYKRHYEGRLYFSHHGYWYANNEWLTKLFHEALING
ncbi:MAG: hypothetical protein ACRC2R_11580 [Xenococcaceae cyanobacterium]